MRKSLAVWLYAIGLLCTAGTALAHHGFAAEYDGTKPIKLSGTITKFEWTNPHAWLYIDVKNDDGTVTNWAFEMSSPNVLFRKGWTRSTLKIGDGVTIDAYRARDGSHNANAHGITMTSTGQVILAPEGPQIGGTVQPGGTPK
jgi:hypothetical protein